MEYGEPTPGLCVHFNRGSNEGSRKGKRWGGGRICSQLERVFKSEAAQDLGEDGMGKISPFTQRKKAKPEKGDITKTDSIHLLSLLKKDQKNPSPQEEEGGLSFRSLTRGKTWSPRANTFHPLTYPVRWPLGRKGILTEVNEREGVPHKPGHL